MFPIPVQTLNELFTTLEKLGWDVVGFEESTVPDPLTELKIGMTLKLEVNDNIVGKLRKDNYL